MKLTDEISDRRLTRLEAINNGKSRSGIVLRPPTPLAMNFSTDGRKLVERALERLKAEAEAEFLADLPKASS
jgi:hypothetical protein